MGAFLSHTAMRKAVIMESRMKRIINAFRPVRWATAVGTIVWITPSKHEGALRTR